jgi:hypothetical protein
MDENIARFGTDTNDAASARDEGRCVSSPVKQQKQQTLRNITNSAWIAIFGADTTNVK